MQSMFHCHRYLFPFSPSSARTHAGAWYSNLRSWQERLLLWMGVHSVRSTLLHPVTWRLISLQQHLSHACHPLASSVSASNGAPINGLPPCRTHPLRFMLREMSRSQRSSVLTAADSQLRATQNLSPLTGWQARIWELVWMHMLR